MNKYVVDRETAEKLKGYLPEGWRSELNYHNIGGGREFSLIRAIDSHKFISLSDGRRYTNIYNGWKYHYEHYPAPILDEMLELLPNFVIVKDEIHELRIYINDGRINYEHDTWEYPDILKTVEFKQISELATAAAKLYIYLVDEGYLNKEGKDERIS